MLRRVTQRKFLSMLPREARASFNKSNNHLELVNGTTIDFLSTSHPENNYGDSVGWIWIDEAALIPKDAFLVFVGRLREGKAEDQRAWLTGTPKGLNWAYDEFQTGKPDRDGVFEVSSADNPYATPEYLEDMRRTYTGAYYEQEFLGRFVKFEGVIYAMIEDATHLRERTVQEMDCFEAAVDWGFDHPWVFGVAGFDSDERGHLFDALHERGLTLDDQITLVDGMLKRYPIQTIYCPDDRPDNIKSYQNAGFPVTVVKREVISGIQTVAAALKLRDDGKAGMTFSPCTEPVYTELKQYQWKVRPDDKAGKEEPLKVKDDGPDMVRYLLHGRKQAQGSAPGIEILFSEDD